MTDAYCCRCRKVVKMKNEKLVELKSGRQAVKGICPNCECKIYKIRKRTDSLSFMLSKLGV